jgi:hypothetical protein
VGKRTTIFLAFLCAVLFGNFAFADAIKLTDSKEIIAASELHYAINAISKKVTACIKQNAGKMEGCLCTTYDACKYKAEYAYASTMFCEVILSYPNWRGNTVNFSLPQDPMSYALGFAGLEKQFGGGCG